jgi:hypothetical protein
MRNLFPLAPLVILAGWAQYLIVGELWGGLPPEQGSHELMRRLAIADFLIVTAVYAVAAWLLVCGRGKAPSLKAWLWTLAAVLLLLTFEVAARWRAAAWGDIWGRISHALGLSVRGYAYIPFLGVLLGPLVCAGGRRGQ